jgi:transcriptional regulator with XRE-family HTH domain
MIGKQLRKLREERNLTQQYMADELKVDRRTYAAWEQEKQDVKSYFIRRLAEILDVEISELFEIKEKNINKQESIVLDRDVNGNVIRIRANKDLIERLIDFLRRI